MNPPPKQPESRPRPPRLYRALAALAGPVEKVFGLTCRDFTRLASAKADQPLTPGEKIRYHLHRMMCGICRLQEKRLRQLNRLVGEVVRESGKDASVKLSPEARQRIQQKLTDEINGR